jgi:hypothetical protein
MRNRLLVGDMSPESALRHRAEGAQRQRDYKDQLVAAGETAEDRLSEAAVKKSQRHSVDGIKIWVPVGNREQSMEQHERRIGRTAHYQGSACRLQALPGMQGGGR